MKSVDIKDLPPCSYSPECLRLIDDLDVPSVASIPMRLSHIDDLQDQRRLRQLRSHVPGCPTCSALLAETRRMRSQQRTILHHFLIANETHVPSTTGAIFAAIRREQALVEECASQDMYAPLPDEMLSSPLPEPEKPPSSVSPKRFPQRRNLLRNFLTLATVAAVILAAIGLLDRFTNHLSTSKLGPPHSDAQVNNYSWDSMVIGLSTLSMTGFTVYNFNATNDQTTILFASTQNIAKVNLEEVSSDGLSLLYDVGSPAQQMTYETFSDRFSSQNLYSLSSDQAGNAIWMDSEHVLVQKMSGAVLELDSQTHLVQHSWFVQTSKLTFYHQPFLYFTDEEQTGPNVLYRINLAQVNAAPQLVAESAPDTHFWLNSDGTTVFYANRGDFGKEGIYAVNSDGTHLHILRSGPGLPIGYTENDGLMLMQQVGTQVEVIKLGVPPQQQEQVVFSDAAPHATSFCSPSGTALIIQLCAPNIALEPHGRGLLLHAYYADGSHSLVYDNLLTGTSQKILSLAADAQVQLPGWSKLSPKKTANLQFSLCVASGL
jgi:hypothetical protein